MKRFHSGRVIAATLIALCGTAATASAADPNGTWKWTFMTQGGQEFELAVTLKAEGEKLTGSLTLPMGDSIEIKDGTFKSDEVNFQVAFERNGNTIVTKYKGKVEGDAIKGTTERERNGETVTREWNPTRQK
jgi:hypothetical protein